MCTISPYPKNILTLFGQGSDFIFGEGPAPSKLLNMERDGYLYRVVPSARKSPQGVDVLEIKIHSITPQGFKIFWWDFEPKQVYTDARKAFASHTIKEALEHFLARNKKHRGILENQLSKAQATGAHARAILEELVK